MARRFPMNPVDAAVTRCVLILGPILGLGSATVVVYGIVSGHSILATSPIFGGGIVACIVIARREHRLLRIHRRRLARERRIASASRDEP